MKKARMNEITKLLGPFSNPNLPLKNHALNRIPSGELKEFQKFLENPIQENKNNLSRPECPVKDLAHSCLARPAYKKRTNEYLEKKYGYGFSHPNGITPSLFEAVLNYLEKN